MTVDQIAGLMLYSAHQAIPSGSTRFGASTYNGKPFQESGAKPFDLSDQQIKFLTKDNLRHVLVTSVESPEVAALWNNKVQALCEGIGFGIPANNSSDPRHRSTSDVEYNVGSAGQISMWPGSLGMAATFDPSVVKQFGQIAAKEYRALGLQQHFHLRLILQPNRAGQESTAHSVKILNLLQIWPVHMLMGSRHLLVIK